MRALLALALIAAPAVAAAEPQLKCEFEGNKTYVQTLTSPADSEEQTFERREVTIGLSDGVNVEITGGITADDQVRGARIDTK